MINHNYVIAWLTLLPISVFVVVLLFIYSYFTGLLSPFSRHLCRGQDRCSFVFCLGFPGLPIFLVTYIIVIWINNLFHLYPGLIIKFWEAVTLSVCLLALALFSLLIDVAIGHETQK